MLQARQAVVQRRRIETIVKLAEIIAKEPIKRVFAEVVTDRLKFGVDPAETAFMLFCERVQLLMAAQKSHSILIGDQDDEQMKNMIRRFNAYRLTGTFWDYGIAIENVVDSVFFARL